MTQPEARSQETEGGEPRFIVLASWLMVLVLALLPRVLDLGGFVTNDEASFWLWRSEIFLRALQTGTYANTAITTHPGVTTMWLGCVGILLRRALVAWEIVPVVEFPLLLALMRLPVALVHTGGILAGYALLRRMLPATVALLAALLWAADPFVIGYSRLLHVDALTATFVTLSILSACYYWHHTLRPGFLALSAVCAALAVLSKSPGLAVLPVVGLIALGSRFPVPRCSFRVLGAQLLAWGGVFAVTLVLVWPAMWADPLRVYELLVTGVTAEGAQPHMTGNFFMGRPDDTPDLRYYPVATALRLTPWTLAGLLLLPWAWRWLELAPAARRDLAALAGFALLFLLAMSLFPKKFDRYLVPIFPALDVLAAVGLVGSIRWLLHSIGQRFAVRGKRLAFGGWGVGLAVLALNAAWWHPYSIAAYNQALGGAPMGARTFSVGWGEGFGQVADWLNQQPDITGVVTASIMTPVLNPYLKHGAQATSPQGGTLPDQTGYVVVYIYQTQGTIFPPFDRFYQQETPLHTVTIHGVNYAWIYQAPPPVAQPRRADFGPWLHLRGYNLEGRAQPGQTIAFKLSWQVESAPPTDYWLFAQLVGPDGQRLTQLDIPYPTSTWQANRYLMTELPVTLPDNLPPGDYRLFMGLYDPASGQRLPLESAHTADPAAAGPNALLLTAWEVDE